MSERLEPLIPSSVSMRPSARVDDDQETFQMMVELFMEHGPKT